MKKIYSQSELDNLLSKVSPRHGWDFSNMKVLREAVPWEYIEEVKKYIKYSDRVLDIGTGGGEKFIQLSSFFKEGVGTDVDTEMVKIANESAKDIENLTFIVTDEKLTKLDYQFDVIINRHAPFNLEAVKKHLKHGGYFITQQVGEKNMLNIKQALVNISDHPPIYKTEIVKSGFDCVEFREYDVEYVVSDIESLIFWLNALDMLHADLVGSEILQSVNLLNHVLEGNVDNRGFVTNEHRYLVVAKYVH